MPNADILFKELSTIKKAKTIAIVLSGTGHDGTEGMKVVKESKGITIAQLLEEAIFDAMPLNAISAKVVDYVLDAQDIANKLLKLVHDLKNGTYETREIPFDEIVKILHNEKQLDLSKYKEDTINRRIQKRMDNLNMQTIQEYATYLKNNYTEIDILNKEVLIGVTEFFRGAEAFDALREHIKRGLLKKEKYSKYRIWSVAYSSGEEAYSLAILANEILEEIDKKIYVKIFASDIDDEALDKARAGKYKLTALKHLKQKHKEKYFTRTEHGYEIVKELREQIVFAHHNFLNNPPFINIDLISCRNVLIYLKPSVQSDIFSIFNYSLNSDGLLFLGSSESTLSSLELFSTLDSKNRIYEKKDEKRSSSLPMPVVSKYAKKSLKKGEPSMQKFVNSSEIEKYLKEDLFKYFRDGSLIIDRDYNIVYKKGDIPYLSFHDGVLSLNLFDNLDKDLHYEIKKLIKKVQLSNVKEISKFVQLKSFQEEKFVQIMAQPFQIPEQKSMILINFIQVEPKELLSNCITLPSFGEESVVQSLSEQLKEARLEIENIAEELTYSKQNTAVMNNELQDSNEKLQSTVEELETSNEELQSSNEELQVSLTSNKELQNKLSLILESSMDGILGLDIHSKHTFANEKAAQMLGYSAEFLIGKESHRLWHHTKPDGSYYHKEECPIVRTLNNGEQARGEDLFWRKDGTSFPVEFVRSPIIEDGEITGAVVSFHDISEKKDLEKKVEQEHEQMLKYLDNSGLVFMILDKKAIL